MRGWEVRARRRSAGLTLDQVARAAGTSASNVSAYERGTRLPHTSTLRRLLAVIDAGGDSPVHTRRLLTVPAAAAALRAGLRAGWPTSDLLRIVRELLSNWRSLTDAADRAAFLVEPTTTGDPRWDALLAAAVENLALTEHFAPPAWTAGHALDTFWFVGESPGLQAYAFARTPISMQVRGVMVDPADLVAV
jgi:transcriptional regulator with XRE-family HTH domain